MDAFFSGLARGSLRLRPRKSAVGVDAVRCAYYHASRCSRSLFPFPRFRLFFGPVLSQQCVWMCVRVSKRLCGCYLPFAVGCESLGVGSLPLRRRLRSRLCQLIPCVPISWFLTCALGSLRWSWNSKIERKVLPFPDGWIDGWSSDVSLGSRGSRNR